MNIDLKSGIPIYKQIINNFKKMIIAGLLEEDEKMPSVRELSRQLTINPNTIQKSYKELEKLGYIYAVKGRGSFVTHPSDEDKNEEKVDELISLLEKTVGELILLGVNSKDIKDKLEDLIKEVVGGNKND